MVATTKSENTPELPLEWRVASALVPYDEALETMEARVAAIHAGEAGELVWLLEHPPLYTAGTSTREEDLLDARFPVHKIGRGGELTYHGPGQRVVYFMLDLNKRGRDVRGFVHKLEALIIAALADFGVKSEMRDDRIGVWVVNPDGSENKIAAIGVRVRKWISFHGIAINVETDLSHYGGIVPCGIRDHGVTSLTELGIGASMSDLDQALQSAFSKVFGDAQTGE